MKHAKEFQSAVKWLFMRMAPSDYDPYGRTQTVHLEALQLPAIGLDQFFSECIRRSVGHAFRRKTDNGKQLASPNDSEAYETQFWYWHNTHIDTTLISRQSDSRLPSACEPSELLRMSLAREELIQLAKTEQSPTLNPGHSDRRSTESVDLTRQLEHRS